MLWDRFAVVDEDRLTIGYGGSACQKSNGSLVDETADTVVVTVYSEMAPGACAMSLQRHEIQVTLDQPLGERLVFDGACLEQSGTALDVDDPTCLREAQPPG